MRLSWRPTSVTFQSDHSVMAALLTTFLATLQCDFVVGGDGCRRGGGGIGHLSHVKASHCGCIALGLTMSLESIHSESPLCVVLNHRF